VAVLFVTLGGCFTYGTVWQLYKYNRLAVLLVTLGGSFSFGTVWQVYS